MRAKTTFAQKRRTLLYFSDKLKCRGRFALFYFGRSKGGLAPFVGRKKFKGVT